MEKSCTAQSFMVKSSWSPQTQNKLARHDCELPRDLFWQKGPKSSVGYRSKCVFCKFVSQVRFGFPGSIGARKTQNKKIFRVAERFFWQKGQLGIEANVSSANLSHKFFSFSLSCADGKLLLDKTQKENTTIKSKQGL